MSVDIPITKLSDDARIPAYAHIGDAGCDLVSTIEATIAPFERLLVPCGFAMALPMGYAGLVLPRSGLASTHGITVVNAPGLIDSGYRGEVCVALINLDAHEDYHIEVGERIAQLLVMPHPEVGFSETDSLDETQRGAGGFGSSGRNTD